MIQRIVAYAATFTLLVTGTNASGSGAPLQAYAASLNLPLSTSKRDIIDASGAKFIYTGTNWPGHVEAMIPEGLQYASIKSIVSEIKGFGLNSVRLTYATQMVDEIYSANGKDVKLADTLTRALGPANGTAVFTQIVKHNPNLTPATTRLQVFDAVAKELAAQGIVLHLDNHVSKAGWCCLPGDGNGWFGEKSFSVANWTRGWSFMAAHGAKNWPSFASVGLRNELRLPLFSTVAEPYDWYTWYVHMTAAAAEIHKVAPKALIFFGGLNSDTDMSKIPLNQTLSGTLLTPSAGKSAVFNPRKLAYRKKIVLEIHKYDNFVGPPYSGTCSDFEADLYKKGFQALNGSDPATKHQFPVVMSEWGFSQDGTTYKNQYPTCLLGFVRKHRFGWLQWGLQGSYYIRQGTQDSDESWGLVNHGWDATRSTVTVNKNLRPMAQAARG